MNVDMGAGARVGADADVGTNVDARLNVGVSVAGARASVVGIANRANPKPPSPNNQCRNSTRNALSMENSDGIKPSAAPNAKGRGNGAYVSARTSM